MINFTNYKLPDKPGVYMFLSEKSEILYTGKAKSLKNRVASYFNKSNKSVKTVKMLEQASDIKFLITNNEVEAFLLEANIIKTEKPKYNILLKDSKTYPYIKITKDKFPRILITRKINDKNAFYFGPFVNVSGLRDIVFELQKIFMLRNCTEGQFNKQRLCMNYQIKRCSGPCSNKITESQYNENVNRLRAFFAGQTNEIKKYFEKKMILNAKNLNFEEAAVFRDRIKALEILFSNQTVILENTNKSIDGFIFHEFEQIQGVTLLIVRGGKLLGSKTYFFDNFIEQEMEETFILQFYSKSGQIPDEIFVYSENSADENLIEKAVLSLSNKKIKIRKRKIEGLIKYGLNNGKLQTELYKNKNFHTEYSLNRLKTLFNLSTHPEYLECVDISHLSGEHTVGVSIAWQDNDFHKKSYRKYKITTAENDDFKAIYEVFTRKAKKILANEEKQGDIYIIDGGIGQLNVAAKTFKEHGLIGNFMSISKGRSIADLKHQGQFSIESIHIYGRANPLKLKRNDKLLLFIQKLRDEAHRFVITYSRSLALKQLTSSPLLNIKGLGKQRLKKLLIEFPDIHSNKEITPELISEKTKIPKNIAEKAIKYLQKND